eukprot:1317407-Rhodomonas_salina.1
MSLDIGFRVKHRASESRHRVQSESGHRVQSEDVELLSRDTGFRVESREPESRHRVQSQMWGRRVQSRQPRVGGQDFGFKSSVQGLSRDIGFSMSLD